VKTLALMGGLLALVLLLWAAPALAADQAPPAWKVYWDWGWKIFNFLVLAFLIVKMAKKPLKEFFANQKAQVAEELEAMNQAKAAAEAELKAIEERTAGLAGELAQFETALSEMAERDRKRLLEEAAADSERILERAHFNAEMSLAHAKQALAREIVALAAELAEEKLKQAVGAADQARLLDEFTSHAHADKS